MTDDSTLSRFITHARSKGMDFATIRTLLLSAGWKEKDIVRAMSSESLDLAVPVPPDLGGARDAFLHLLSFVAFHTAAVSFVLLLFSLVDRVLPDLAMDRGGTERQWNSLLRWLIAQIVIGCPLFLLLWRHLLGEIRQRPEKAASPIRRWLTYLTLFVAAATLMGTAVTLLYYFLEGELTVRFVLKVSILATIAGLSLLYFLRCLRGSDGPLAGESDGVRWHRRFGWLAAGLVASALIWGLFAVGSPFAERIRKLDQRRLADLQNIVEEMERVVLERRRTDGPKLARPLPSTLEELVESAEYLRLEIRDPETGHPYEYEVLRDGCFRLCATFQFDRDERTDVIWNHPAGRSCFEFDLLRP